MEVRKEDQRDPDEKVVEIEIERLRDFKNHPFKVQAEGICEIEIKSQCREVRADSEEKQNIKSEGGTGMNQKEFNEVIVRQTDRCKSMLMTKGSEYAPKAVKNAAVDRLAHFKKAAVVMNSTPKAALMGMLSKHLISLSDMCTDERQYAKEQWDEKITDSINYFLILWAIVEEELSEEN